MTALDTMRRAAAVGAVCALAAGLGPARAETPGGAVSGRVLDAETQAPLVGARVHLAAAERPEGHVSDPTDATGAFTVDDIPDGSWMLGVEIDGRLHVVPAPVSVAPGQTRDVQVEVQRNVVSVAPAAGGGVWARPLYASLIIIGGAIVLGLLLEQALDEDLPVSPSAPN